LYLGKRSVKREWCWYIVVSYWRLEYGRKKGKRARPKEDLRRFKRFNRHIPSPSFYIRVANTRSLSLHQHEQERARKSKKERLLFLFPFSYPTICLQVT